MGIYSLDRVHSIQPVMGDISSHIDPSALKSVSQATQHIFVILLEIHGEMERLTAKNSKLFEIDVTQNIAEISRLQEEKDATLKNEAEAAAKKNSWSTWQNVAGYVTNVMLITLGSALIGTGAGSAPGGLLIGAGVIGIGNRIIQDTNLLPAVLSWWTKSEQLQKKIAEQIEMGSFCLVMGLGLTGGLGAWQTGSIIAGSSLSITKKVTSAVSTASGILGTSFKVGVEFHKKSIAELEAARQEINYWITSRQHTTTQNTTQMSQMIGSLQAEERTLMQGIRSLEVEG